MADTNTTTNELAFITTQKELAKAVGISHQYLSMAKRDYLASESLVQRLVKTTGIEANYWLYPRFKAILHKKLKEFFRNEKVKKANALNTESSTVTD